MRVRSERSRRHLTNIHALHAIRPPFWGELFKTWHSAKKGSFFTFWGGKSAQRRYNLGTPRVRMPHQILSTLSPLNSLETSATLGQNNPVKRSSMESNRATMATTTVQVDVCIRWRVESYNWRRKEEKNRERGGETSLAGCVFLTGN